MIHSHIYNHFYLNRKAKCNDELHTQTRNLKSTYNTVVHLNKMNTLQENNIIESNFSCGRWDLTKEENELQESIGFWVQSIASLVIGSFGILVNLVTIVVLSTPDLRKLFFNKLLLLLTVFDSFFLLSCLYESIRLHIIKTDYCALQGQLLIVLRPFRHISMYCST